MIKVVKLIQEALEYSLTDNIVKIGIIGCGRISGHHCRSIVETEGAELVAVCDMGSDGHAYVMNGAGNTLPAAGFKMVKTGAYVHLEGTDTDRICNQIWIK